MTESKTTDETAKGSKVVVIEAFTPLILNNQIVGMRKVANLAKNHTIRKLNRQLKKLETRVEKRKNPRLEKQKEKIMEELVAVKSIKKDEISKFALINKDSLSKLLNRPNVSASERVLYKVATNPSVEANVASFRLSHPGCDVSCAFMMQRLGLQYQAQKAEKKGAELKKKLKSGEKIEVEAKDTESTEEQKRSAKNEPKKESKSVIAKVLSKKIELAKKDEQRIVAGKKRKLPEAPLEVKPIERLITTSKEAIVKKLKLAGGDEEDDEEMDESEEEEEDEDSGSEDEEKSEGEEEKEEEKEPSKEEEEEEDGLSSFFLNKDGSSRAVKREETEDVEDEEIEEGRKGRGGYARGRGSAGGGRRGTGRGAISSGGNRQFVGRGGGEFRGGKRKELRGGGGGGGGDRSERGCRGGKGGHSSAHSTAPTSCTQPVDLHPSWIAKMELRKKMEAGPSGKKITFD